MFPHQFSILITQQEVHRPGVLPMKSFSFLHLNYNPGTCDLDSSFTNSPESASGACVGLLPDLVLLMEPWDKFVQVSVQFSSVAQSCPTLCDPMNRSMPGLPVHHQLPEPTQTHAHRGGDAIQPSHPLSPASPSAPNPSQHQGLFQWLNSTHEVAKVLEPQPQHQSFQ